MESQTPQTASNQVATEQSHSQATTTDGDEAMLVAVLDDVRLFGMFSADEIAGEIGAIYRPVNVPNCVAKR